VIHQVGNSAFERRSENASSLANAKMQSTAELLIAWAGKAAPFFIAIPMGIFGVQHFIYLDFVAHFIPEWIPWRVFWACFTGVALIAAAGGIIFKLWDRSAATLLGIMIFLWVVLLHTSRIAAEPAAFAEWRGIFQALAMSGCAFALAGNAGSPRSLKLAPLLMGVGMIGLGAEHFIFAKVTAPQVPVWIPGTVAGNYLAGALLIGCGAGFCWNRSRRDSAVLLAVLVFSSMLVFHLPVALRSSRFESDWTKTFVLSGGAILLARDSKKVNPAFPRRV
jgi:uncharacterized membrane protein